MVGLHLSRTARSERGRLLDILLMPNKRTPMRKKLSWVVPYSRSARQSPYVCRQVGYRLEDDDAPESVPEGRAPCLSLTNMSRCVCTRAPLVIRLFLILEYNSFRSSALMPTLPPSPILKEIASQSSRAGNYIARLKATMTKSKHIETTAGKLDVTR